MKKIIFSIMAVAALFACQKETVPVDDSAVEKVSFTAYVDGADTKTVLDGEAVKTMWSGEEWIQIVGSQAYWFGTENISTPSLSATFTYNGNNGEYVEDGAVIAVYPAGGTPYTADIANKTVGVLTVPSKQYPKAGTFDPNAAIAVAYAENSTLAFKNAVTLLKFTMGADNVTAACIYANDGGDISGTFSAAMTTGVPVLTGVVEGEGNGVSQWVDFYPGEGSAFVKGEDYYVAIAPATFRNGFTVSLGGKDVRKYDSSATFERNVIYDMGTIGTDADSGDPIAPWSVAGTFNGWTATPMTLDNDMYVYRNVTGLNFTAQSDDKNKSSTGFKFIQNGTDWKGGEGQVKTGTWAYIWNDNGSNIYVEGASAETVYDIYLNPAADADGGIKFVVVAAGAEMPEDSHEPITPEPGTYSWGLVGEHQKWDITNPTLMEKVAEDVYAVKNISLMSPGFKFATTGLSDWNAANTHFGAWKDSGSGYFNFSTEMSDGAWYEVYSNNLGNDSKNIGVSDWTKKYDIYLKIVEKADWGQKMAYTVVEHGTDVEL